MPLHIDFRPANFLEFIGNESTIKSLRSVLGREDKPHSLLFQGPSGCGKTTLARIVANQLKCHEQDLIEVNAANNRGIDTAREIIQTCYYMPVAGPVRVILIDEVGATVKTFQEALLKPLEDTPDHVFFILCTTDPGKLLKTIRNRCSVFEVNPLSDKQIGELIDWVLKEEKLELDEKARAAIIESAEGCPRQCLVIMDQVIDLPLGEQEAAVQDAMIGDAQVIELCRALIKQHSWPEIAQILKGIKEEPEKVRYAVLGYMNAVLLGGEPFYSGKALLTQACWESLDKEQQEIPF